MAVQLLSLSTAPRRAAAPARLRAPRRAMASSPRATAASSPLGYDLNFGPASSLDTVVYGSVRPGGAGVEEVTPAGSISDAAVAAWAAEMKAQGITRVVSLLDATELTAYASPLKEQYGRHFKRCALSLILPASACAPLSSLGCRTILDAKHATTSTVLSDCDACRAAAGIGTTW